MDSLRSEGADWFEAVAEEFVARVRAGEDPSIDSYAARYPERTEEIRELFPMLARMETLKQVGSPDPATKSRELPERIGDYRVFREIGRGGMGVVYEAEQESLGRRVALKVLPTPLARSESARERFLREARAAAGLHHTNIVPVFDVGTEDGFDYYAMQFIRGQGLDQVVDQLSGMRSSAPQSDETTVPAAPRPPTDLRTLRIANSLNSGRFEFASDSTSSASTLTGSGSSHGGTGVRARGYFRTIARLGHAVADALDHAHSRGVVHRDIKPSNLLLDTDGEVWVADFGLAKTDDVDLTQTGEFVGTLRYMAPERFHGESGAPGDVYSLGATLYELATLRPAFDATDRVQLMEAVQNRHPTTPRAVDRRVPPDLETIILKAMAKEPTRRYASARALASDLERFIEDRPIRARRVSSTERLVRWSRRNPALALSLSGVFVLLALVATVFAVGEDRARARSEDLQQQLYRSEMIQAGLASNSVLGLFQVERLTTKWQHELDVGWEWFHLDALAHPHLFDVRVAEETTGGHLGFTPDGGHVFVSLATGEIRIIEFATHREVATLPPLGTHVMAIEASPTGASMLVATLAGDVHLHDATTWQETHRFELTAPGQGGQLVGAQWHPNGRSFVADFNGSRPSEVYEIQGDRAVLSWEVEGKRATFSPDGLYLAAIPMGVENVRGRPLVVVYDFRTQHEVATCHGGPVIKPAGLRFSPDGESLAWGTLRKGAFLWEDWPNTTEATLCTTEVYADGNVSVESLSWSPTGEQFVTSGRDGLVRVWDRSTGSERRRYSATDGWISEVEWSPHAEVIASLSRDLHLRAWNVSLPPPVFDVETGSGAWTRSSFHVGADADRVLYGGTSVDLAEAVVGRLAFVAWAWDGADRCWSPTSPPQDSPDDPTELILYSSDGEVLARQPMPSAPVVIARAPGIAIFFITWRNQLMRIDEDLSQPPRLLAEGVTQLPRVMSVSPDGRWVVAPGPNAITWFDGNTGERVRKIPVPSQASSLEFDPASQILAVTLASSEVRLYDAETGNRRPDLAGHLRRPLSSAFSPDGTRIATGGADGTTRLWDPATSELITVFDEGENVFHVEWSADGRRLISLLKSGRLRVRDAVDYPMRR